MKKIPTLFLRDLSNRKLVIDRVTPGLEWVLEGSCVAREKLDGTSCAVLGGILYRRFTKAWYEGAAPTPKPFIPSCKIDEGSGKQAGWVPVGDGPEDEFHREAQKHCVRREGFSDGTYELIGPKVQGNPYGCKNHHLMRHDSTDILHVPDLSFSGLKGFLALPVPSWDDLPLGDHLVEGVVFWGPEGPVAKVKRLDFGLPWPIKEPQT